MRTLLVCALASALIGCSRQPTLPSCVGANPLACLTAVHVPLEPESYDSDSATKKLSAVAEHGDRPTPSHADHAVRQTPQPIKVATKAATAVPTGLRSSQTNQQATGNAVASEATRESVTGSTTSDASPDALVVVLMAGPGVKSVSNLAGKTIAIDDRYSGSISSVRTAMAAAGALEVQLSKGQTTAINRLASNEVRAAVVALVPAGAADSFPELARFRTFRIPLSPRAAERKAQQKQS